MSNLNILIKPVRARRTDPATSQAAARNAERFAASHAGRIMAALSEGPRSAKGIEAITGLTVVQVDRRIVELQRSGLCEPLVCDQGVTLVIGGCRVWRVAA
jgi:hypothetical protein